MLVTIYAILFECKEAQSRSVWNSISNLLMWTIRSQQKLLQKDEKGSP